MEHSLKFEMQAEPDGQLLPVGDPERIKASCIGCGWSRRGAYSDELQQAYDQHKVLPRYWLDAYGSEEIVHSAPKTALRAHLAPKLFEAMEDVLEYVSDLERQSQGTAFEGAMAAIMWEIRNRVADRLAPPVTPEGR